MRRMEPKEKKAFEPTGLVPRSIVRTFERFRQQLLPGSERAAIREYRISRYQVLVSARCLFALLTIPIATNWFVSTWLLSPIIEHYWNTQQNEIFLNSYQEERAFAELEFFSDKLFFESLLSNQNDDYKNPKGYQAEKPFNIEIAKPRSFPEDNQRLLFRNIEELSGPFGRSSDTQFCGENYFVKAVGGDRMEPQQDACTSDVLLPPTMHLSLDLHRRCMCTLFFAPSVHNLCPLGADPMHTRTHSFCNQMSFRTNEMLHMKQGALCKGSETNSVKDFILKKLQNEKMLTSQIHEINRKGCQGQTTDTNPFHSVQSSNFDTPIILTNRCLPSTPFPQLSWTSSDMANSKKSPGLTSLFVGFNSNASVVCHAFHHPCNLFPPHAASHALAKVYQGAQSSQRPLPSVTLTPTFFSPPVHRGEVSAKNQSYISVFDFALKKRIIDSAPPQVIENKLSVSPKVAAEQSTIGSFPAFGLTLPPYFQLGWGKVNFSDSLLGDAPEVKRKWELRLPKVKDAEKIVHPGTPSLVHAKLRAEEKDCRDDEMHGKRPLVKRVNSNKLESKATTALKQNADNKPIEGTEEFASCTNGVNSIGNFSSQTVIKENPEGEDLMRQLGLNTSTSNMQKVQMWKSRQATFVDRQLHYSAPLAGKNSLDDIWNINNTENSVKIKERIQEKIVELAVYYNEQTILSITNIAGDFVSVLTLGFLFIWMKPEISILKSFLIEAIYSLSDTTKSFLLILLTDLLVGFHSPRGWETALELLLKHFGLPENQDFVFLFVATFPVLLDTVFKYWIFRHLNKISPSTVATYHSMIE